MVRKTQKFLSDEKEITKCILRGLSNEQIAKKLNYSRSTICYRINILFKKHYAKTRQEFVLAVLAKLVKRKKDLIATACSKIDVLETKNDKIREILSKIVSQHKNPSLLSGLIDEARTVLNKN